MAGWRWEGENADGDVRIPAGEDAGATSLAFLPIYAKDAEKDGARNPY
jgi:hypothetical protein